METHFSILSAKSHGQRSLVGCYLWGRIELDTTERLHFHFSLSCIGEGNGNPLQCSCLENSGDGGAWWAAVYGVTQSRAQLKRLSPRLNLSLLSLFHSQKIWWLFSKSLERCNYESPIHIRIDFFFPQIRINAETSFFFYCDEHIVYKGNTAL